jgi:hypothetical protein
MPISAILEIVAPMKFFCPFCGRKHRIDEDGVIHAEGPYDEACSHLARSQRVEGAWWELDFVYCFIAPAEY